MASYNFGHNQNRDTGSWPNLFRRNSYSGNQNVQPNSRFPWGQSFGRNNYRDMQQINRQPWERYPQQNNARSMFPQQQNMRSMFPQQQNNMRSMFPQQNNNTPSMFPQQNNNAPPMFPQQSNNAPAMFPQQNNNAPPMFPQQNNNAPFMFPQQNDNDPPLNSAPPETRHMPDGVTIHPLDQNTMNELRRGNMGVLGSIGTQPPIQEIAGGEAPLSTSKDKVLSPGASNDISDSLRSFIHDERNASLFYKYLSGIAPRKDYRNMLTEISEGCTQRKKILGDIYNSLKGEIFTPRDAVVDTSVGFNEGLRWAISVENTALRNLCDLYESASDALIGKRLATQMYRKFCDLSSLHLMMR